MLFRSDKYHDVWSIQITSAAADLLLSMFVKILVEEFSPLAIVEKNDIAIRKKEGLPLREDFLL